MKPLFSRADNISLPHAFFSREGGVSEGVYTSLNGGLGSFDDIAAIAENRRRMAQTMGVSPERFLTPFQIHSPLCMIVDGPFASRPRCDGLATATPELALSVTGADCGMILFADAENRVIGAAHAGWKGALGGVLEATILCMEQLGARRETIHAALGPMIGTQSYEVGPEFYATFVATEPGYSQFFSPSKNPNHYWFNLPGFIALKLKRAGIANFVDLELDTYNSPKQFYSFRRATHRGEPDYGRLISAIKLPAA